MGGTGVALGEGGWHWAAMGVTRSLLPHQPVWEQGCEQPKADPGCFSFSRGGHAGRGGQECGGEVASGR